MSLGSWLFLVYPNQGPVMKLPRLVCALAVSVFALGRFAPEARAADPVVSGVAFAQRPGTKQVDITYDVVDPDSNTVAVSLRISSDDGATWTVPATSLWGDVGAAVVAREREDDRLGRRGGLGRGLVGPGECRGDGDGRRRRHGHLSGDRPLSRLRRPPAIRSPISTPVPEGGWTDEYKTTKLVLRRILAGTFNMGSPGGELGRAANETQHQVTLTQDFYIGVFEVTQKQWNLVMDAWPSYFNNPTYRDARPVEQVSWNEIRGGTWPGTPRRQRATRSGCVRRQAPRPDGARPRSADRGAVGVRLPGGDLHRPELEQEPDGDHPFVRTWPKWGGTGITAAVATPRTGIRRSARQRWGLTCPTPGGCTICTAMSGSRAWTGGWINPGNGGGATDPLGGSSALNRTLLAGGWSYKAQYCRSAQRSFYYPDNRHDSLGFRLGIPVPAGVGFHSVAFDLGMQGTRTGGGALFQTVAHGEAAVAPAFTVVKGWTFAGWSTVFANVTEKPDGRGAV